MTERLALQISGSGPSLCGGLRLVLGIYSVFSYSDDGLLLFMAGD